VFNYTFICHYDFLHVGTSFLPCNIGLFLYYELVINNIGIKSNRFKSNSKQQWFPDTKGWCIPLHAFLQNKVFFMSNCKVFNYIYVSLEKYKSSCLFCILFSWNAYSGTKLLLSPINPTLRTESELATSNCRWVHPRRILVPQGT